jgi:hypothetical protein
MFEFDRTESQGQEKKDIFRKGECRDRAGADLGNRASV